MAETPTILDIAWEIAEQPRIEMREHVKLFAQRLRIVQGQLEEPLLTIGREGDETPVDPGTALLQLSANGDEVWRPKTVRTGKHERGHDEACEAFMLADAAAAGIAAAHEITTGQVIERDEQDALAAAL